jgi:hypothetical protein
VIETDYNPDEKTEEQKIKMKNFLAAVHNGGCPLLTLKDIQDFIDPNAQVITAGGEKIKPNQYTDFRDVRSTIYRYIDRQAQADAEAAQQQEKEEEKKALNGPFKFSSLKTDLTDEPYYSTVKSLGYDGLVKLPGNEKFKIPERYAAFKFGDDNTKITKREGREDKIIIEPRQSYAVPFKKNGRLASLENAVVVESRKRGKNVIRITEEDLRRIIKKCVNEQLRCRTLY